MVKYDASIIQQFAKKLYDQAQRIIVRNAMVGALFGAAAGLVLSSIIRMPENFLAIMGAVLFGALGVSLARAQAFVLRLQAQTALCQVQIELNSRPRPPEPQTFAQPPR